MPRAFDEVASYRYVSLTTFRRNGIAVPVPVWVAPDGDNLVVITDDHSGKVRRLRRDARVELRRCDIRGRVADAAPLHRGEGVVVRGPDEVAAVQRAIGRKYPSYRIGNLLSTLIRRVRTTRPPRVGIRLTLVD